MGYWLCAENDIEDLKVNSWCWGATVALIQQSDILEPDVELIGDRMVFAESESCAKLAHWLESDVLPELPNGSRVKLDGSVATIPEYDGTIHREDLAENYSVTKDWLIEFTSFLRTCGGFSTLG